MTDKPFESDQWEYVGGSNDAASEGCFLVFDGVNSFWGKPRAEKFRRELELQTYSDGWS